MDQEALDQEDSFDASSYGSDNEAARENESMQAMVSVLQDPSISDSLGFLDRPQCFHPLEPEVYAASFLRLVL